MAENKNTKTTKKANKNEPVLLEPVVKWAGGKRRLIKSFEPLLPELITTYYEPFVGGGAMLFHLQPKKAFVNDINKELINVYKVIKEHPKALINDLKKHKNTEEYYYEIRALDREPDVYNKLSDVKKASRFIYLNKTCYNGLFRVNNGGQFNVPFGFYPDPVICDSANIMAISKYFNSANIQFSSFDFEDALSYIKGNKGSFVYLDPPYDTSDGKGFTAYSKNGFPQKSQIRLRQCCDILNERGIKFMMSNSATDFILDQYKDYNISYVKTNYPINSKGSGRKTVKEVVIRNYE